MAWSLWAAVVRPLVIGIGAGLIVALLLYVLGVSCVWLCQKIKLASGIDVENRGGSGVCAEGTGHPGGLPTERGVPNGGVEDMPLHDAHAHATTRPDLEMGARKHIAEAAECADQPLVSDNAPNEDLKYSS